MGDVDYSRVLSDFGRWLDDKFQRVTPNFSRPFLDYLKSNKLWDFRGEKHGGDGEFMPENMAEGLITTIEDRGNGTGSWQIKEKWIEDCKYVYLIQSTFHLGIKEEFYFVCSGVIGEPDGSARSESSIKYGSVKEAPWKSKVEFMKDYVEANGRWEELCVKFFGSPPVFCEAVGCHYRTQGKLCEKHVESPAAQEEMFS